MAKLELEEKSCGCAPEATAPSSVASKTRFFHNVTNYVYLKQELKKLQKIALVQGQVKGPCAFPRVKFSALGRGKSGLHKSYT